MVYPTLLAPSATSRIRRGARRRRCVPVLARSRLRRRRASCRSCRRRPRSFRSDVAGRRSHLCLGARRSLEDVRNPSAEEHAMAIACPVDDLDTRKLRDEIRSIYARVANDPSGEFPFPSRPDYAGEFLATTAPHSRSFPKKAPPRSRAWRIRTGSRPSRRARLSWTSAAAREWICCSRRSAPGRMARHRHRHDRIDGREGPRVGARGRARQRRSPPRRRDVAAARGLERRRGHLERRLEPHLRQVGRLRRGLPRAQTGGRFLYADIVVANELSESIRKDVDLWTG